MKKIYLLFITLGFAFGLYSQTSQFSTLDISNSEFIRIQGDTLPQMAFIYDEFEQISYFKHVMQIYKESKSKLLGVDITDKVFLSVDVLDNGQIFLNINFHYAGDDWLNLRSATLIGNDEKISWTFNVLEMKKEIIKDKILNKLTVSETISIMLEENQIAILKSLLTGDEVKLRLAGEAINKDEKLIKLLSDSMLETIEFYENF